jgi:hypothetical protein
MDPFRYLDYGALGAAILVLLVAVAVLFRVLMWVREILEMVLKRIQENTQALTLLSVRLDEHPQADDLSHGLLRFRLNPGEGNSPETEGP